MSIEFFLEAIEHVHRFGKFRDIQHPVFITGVHTNLPHPWPDYRHRSPVGRLIPLLRFPQLEPGA